MRDDEKKAEGSAGLRLFLTHPLSLRPHPFKGELAEGLRDVKVGLLGAGRLPGEVSALWAACADAAKEVDAPVRARARRMGKSLPWPAHSNCEAVFEDTRRYS